MIPPKKGKLYKLCHHVDFYRDEAFSLMLCGNSLEKGFGIIGEGSVLLLVKSIRNHRSSTEKSWTMKVVCGEEIGYFCTHWDWQVDMVLYEE